MARSVLLVPGAGADHTGIFFPGVYRVSAYFVSTWMSASHGMRTVRVTLTTVSPSRSTTKSGRHSIAQPISANSAPGTM